MCYLYCNIGFTSCCIRRDFGSLYWEQVKHLSRVDATFAPMMIFMGTIIGSPIAGWLSDRIELRRMPMIVGAVLSVIVSMNYLFARLSLAEYILLLFLLGFTSSTQIISYPTVARK